MTFEEYVDRLADSGTFGAMTWRQESRKVLLHGHCHQKSLVGTGPAERCLSLPPGYTVETIELLRSTFESWKEVAAAWPDPVGFHLVEVDFTKPADPAERLYLNALPTSFRLDDEAVDRLRAAGRDSLEADPEFRVLVEALGGRTRPVRPD